MLKASIRLSSGAGMLMQAISTFDYLIAYASGKVEDPHLVVIPDILGILYPGFIGYNEL